MSTDTSMMLASYVLKEQSRRTDEIIAREAARRREIRRLAGRMSATAVVLASFVVAIGLAG